MMISAEEEEEHGGGAGQLSLFNVDFPQRCMEIGYVSEL
jgi:hypothetical protein